MLPVNRPKIIIVITIWITRSWLVQRASRDVQNVQCCPGNMMSCCPVGKDAYRQGNTAGIRPTIYMLPVNLWIDLKVIIVTLRIQVIEIVRKNVRVLCVSLQSAEDGRSTLPDPAGITTQSVENLKLYQMFQRVFSHMLWNGGRGLSDCLRPDQRWIKLPTAGLHYTIYKATWLHWIPWPQKTQAKTPQLLL